MFKAEMETERIEGRMHYRFILRRVSGAIFSWGKWNTGRTLIERNVKQINLFFETPAAQQEERFGDTWKLTV